MILIGIWALWETRDLIQKMVYGQEHSNYLHHAPGKVAVQSQEIMLLMASASEK